MVKIIRIKNLINRDGLKDEMLKNGIQIGVYYKLNHQLSYFQDEKGTDLPVTNMICSEIISLPLNSDITDKHVEHVVSTLNNILPKYIK